MEYNEKEYQEFLKEQQEIQEERDFYKQHQFAEEEKRDQLNAWKAANGMFEDEDENYYHG